jgi:dihydroorotase
VATATNVEEMSAESLSNRLAALKLRLGNRTAYDAAKVVEQEAREASSKASRLAAEALLLQRQELQVESMRRNLEAQSL